MWCKQTLYMIHDRTSKCVTSLVLGWNASDVLHGLHDRARNINMIGAKRRRLDQIVMVFFLWELKENLTEVFNFLCMQYLAYIFIHIQCIHVQMLWNKPFIQSTAHYNMIIVRSTSMQGQMQILYEWPHALPMCTLRHFLGAALPIWERQSLWCLWKKDPLQYKFYSVLYSEAVSPVWYKCNEVKWMCMFIRLCKILSYPNPPSQRKRCILIPSFPDGDNPWEYLQAS